MYFRHLTPVMILALSSSHVLTHLKNSDATQLSSNQLGEVQRPLYILWNRSQWKSINSDILMHNTLRIGAELQQETSPHTHATSQWFYTLAKILQASWSYTPASWGGKMLATTRFAVSCLCERQLHCSPPSATTGRHWEPDGSQHPHTEEGATDTHLAYMRGSSFQFPVTTRTAIPAPNTGTGFQDQSIWCTSSL